MRLQPLARRRLAGLGPAGAAWLDALPRLLDDLEERWQVRVERRSLPGGSNGLVAPATAKTGEPRVVKVAGPGVSVARQAQVLAAAGGRGHVRLHAHDPDREALLLDRLGRSLAQSPASVRGVVNALASTLVEAWAASAPALPAEVPDRADDLVRGLEDLAARGGHDAAPAVLAQARACAARRSAARDPARCVVVHGDAHPANLLRAPAAPTGWLLVDAEGPVAERAYDVGVALRDLSSHLQDPATAAARLSAWCAQAAAVTGTEPDAVWDWAFLERVSTGLYVSAIGSPAVGRPMLTSAAAVLAGLEGLDGPDWPDGPRPGGFRPGGS